MSKESILEQFSLYDVEGGGIGDWLTDDPNDDQKNLIFDRLDQLPADPLSKTQLNQLLVLGREAPVSDGFFAYYWLENPPDHPYCIKSIPDFDVSDLGKVDQIISLPHLEWGLQRLYMDGLMYFGNVRTAFRELRTMTREQLAKYFAQRRFDTSAMKQRGSALRLEEIPEHNRRLVSERVFPSFDENADPQGKILNVLVEAYREFNGGDGEITVGNLIDSVPQEENSGRRANLKLAMHDILDVAVASRQELEEMINAVTQRYSDTRKAARTNTYYYLSMTNDLDVYVATSMGTHDDFVYMVDFCRRVFESTAVQDLQLRYFDPTMSVAEGHEDKGLIECLMVKCAKVLVYCAGERDSYGKDAEAAMALSLGKPVISYFDDNQRSRSLREFHPLNRLIEFETGVAVGAMHTDSVDDVATLLSRIFSNRMKYRLEQHETKTGYILLKEEITNSVVRLQTDDRLLTETFWNHYHNRPQGR